MSSEFAIKWKDEKTAAYMLNAANLHQIHPDLNAIDNPFLVQASQTTLAIKAHTAIKIISSGGVHAVFQVTTDTVITVADNLDTGSISAGKDYCVFLCNEGDGSASVVISLNSTYPTGYTASNSRKIGGFHTLCLAVAHDATLSAWAPDTAISVGETRKARVWDGYIYRCTAIADTGHTHADTEPTWSTYDVGDPITDNNVTWLKEQHALEGYASGAILPESVWDLLHRPRSSANGMVWSDRDQGWLDVYLQSGTLGDTESAYGGTITDTRTWNDHVDDLSHVSKKLLSDSSFQTGADGSNEESNIAGSSDPVTSGGHLDTYGRRLISHIGCEDCCGAMWQWLRTQSYQYDTSDWSWYALPGGKGQLYHQGTYGDVKLLAGAGWAHGTASGSRARNAACCRWSANSIIGGRGRAEPK